MTVSVVLCGVYQSATISAFKSNDNSISLHALRVPHAACGPRPFFFRQQRVSHLCRSLEWLSLLQSSPLPLYDRSHFNILVQPIWVAFVYTKRWWPPISWRILRFCDLHQIRHELSAPYNPKSNGLAEAGVKSVKNILRKSGSSGADADSMLYEWRNVPRSDRYIPAQLLFGRVQRTSLPTLPSQNKPIDFESAASSKDAAHARSKLDHDKSNLSLSRLSPGQDVFSAGL